MQLWRKGEDQIDGLTPKHLWKHMSKKPPGPKQPDAKRAPPPRIKCAAIVEVARLVKRHGPHMRQLLKLDVAELTCSWNWTNVRFRLRMNGYHLS